MKHTIFYCLKDHDFKINDSKTILINNDKVFHHTNYYPLYAHGLTKTLILVTIVKRQTDFCKYIQTL